jgi:valyl-tRNA synthetase
VKITPAHDFNDFEVGKRHGLPMINILDVEAKPSPEGQRGLPRRRAATRPPSEDDADAARLDRFAGAQARRRDDGGAGLLEKIEPHTHMVPHGDRSGVPIEPFLTDQWYVDAKTLAKPAIAAVRDGRTKFVPKNWEKTYFDWMENIQPWCISRQLWWGHQIPAWYGPDGNGLRRRDEEEARRGARLHAPKAAPWKAGRGEARENFERRREILTATRTCSTPGSPRRCGRSRRSAGRTRRPN